jgi:DNA-binding NarL/FixJ family response regulator
MPSCCSVRFLPGKFPVTLLTAIQIACWQNDLPGAGDRYMNRAFPFLERSIEILIVDDEWSVAAAYAGILNLYKLYNVTCASSVKEADLILSSSKRCHVCLLDLGLTDIDNDEYYLIKKFSPRISFIVVSGRDSLQKGFQAGMHGALAAISKPVDFYKLDFIDIINEAFLQSLIIPEDMNNCKPIIKNAIEVLISSKPASIMHWADKVGVEERYLRKVWTDCFEYQPKYVLWLHRIFSHAFSYYKSFYCEKGKLKTETENAGFKDKGPYYSGYKRFYNAHKSTIDYILKSRKLKM